jgi:hypothetical protein
MGLLAQYNIKLFLGKTKIVRREEKHTGSGVEEAVDDDWSLLITVACNAPRLKAFTPILLKL